jgi:hypothetical protein
MPASSQGIEVLLSLHSSITKCTLENSVWISISYVMLNSRA